MVLVIIYVDGEPVAVSAYGQVVFESLLAVVHDIVCPCARLVNAPPLPGAVMLSDKTMEHICRLVDDSPPFTDDDLASLSTILRPEPLNVAAKFPTQSLTNRLRCNNSRSCRDIGRLSSDTTLLQRRCAGGQHRRMEPSFTWLHQTVMDLER